MPRARPAPGRTARSGRTAPGRRSEAQRIRARAIISVERSTPTTRCPASSSAQLTSPGPQPASSTRLSGGNPACSTSRRRASGSLCTGAFSNFSAWPSKADARLRSWSDMGGSRRSTFQKIFTRSGAEPVLDQESRDLPEVAKVGWEQGGLTRRVIATIRVSRGPIWRTNAGSNPFKIEAAFEGNVLAADALADQGDGMGRECW